jgi:hypothetical protein
VKKIQGLRIETWGTRSVWGGGEKTKAWEEEVCSFPCLRIETWDTRRMVSNKFFVDNCTECNYDCSHI